MSENTVFNSIMTGLNEAIEDANSKKPILKRHKVTVEPVKVYNSDEVKKIRATTGMSQKTFASYLGVSGKTVEAWELGRTHPTGPAYRLLNILDQGKEAELSFVSVKAK